MNRSVGGEILIDLLPIELEESVDSETFTNITEQSIIEQLTNLKQYINNQKMIKPVWVKLLNGEDDKIVVVKGQLSKVVDQPEFDIEVSIKGYTLTIHVEFTQVTLSDDTPIDDWYIDTGDAKYLFTSEAQNIGAISELPIFENIVDKNGNSRFIEGNGIPLSQTGFTSSYCKWSLSGSHLLIVLAGSIANETILENGANLATYNLPEWIVNKIYSVWIIYIESKNLLLKAEDWSTQDSPCVLTKVSTGLRIVKVNDLTLNANRSFRIQFDLLIDID